MNVIMLIIWRFPAYRLCSRPASKVGPTPRTVIADELPTLAGQHLTLRHLTPDGEETPVVLNTDGELVDASTCRQARLFVTQYVTLADGQRVTVKSGLQRLKEAAEKLSLAQYSEQCGVPEAQIIALAETFASHGRKAAVISHGGMMASNGVL